MSRLFRVMHIIESLGIGGAEKLLLNTVDKLEHLEHFIVYFKEPSTLLSRFTHPKVHIIYIEYSGYSDAFKTLRLLKGYIKTIKPDLIHSHLFIANLFSRLVTPKNIPLINSIHSLYSVDAFEKNKLSLFFEKVTLKKRHNLIAVSEVALNDYLKYVRHKGKAFVLYNFIPDHFFSPGKNYREKQNIKCIAIGNLKEAKNYSYLLQIFERLKEEPISLEIYGDGPLRMDIEEEIKNKSLKIIVKGQKNELNDILPEYDLFLQVSKHEGFGLTVIEAMAARVPVVISDIPIFREISNGYGHFIPLDSLEMAITKVRTLMSSFELRSCFVNEAFNYVNKKYTEKSYISELMSIYKIVQSGIDNHK